MLKNYEQKRSNFETSYHKDNWGRRTGLFVLTIYKSIWGIYLMRDPKIVLKQLSGLKEDQRVTNLYKNLYNPEFYKIAYQNLYSASKINNINNADGMSEERINTLIEKLKNKTYQPTPIKIPSNTKKNSTITTKISSPSIEDKLVQEIVRMILESLYQNVFSEHSYGYMTNKSPHTALIYTKQKFNSTKWWIDIDIKDCFKDINHVIILNILKEKIREQKFIALINKFLKAGYIKFWQNDKTYSGTPQGTTIGQILSNIYLNKFDKYMENLIKEFNCGVKRQKNKEYERLRSRAKNYKYRFKDTVENKNKYLLYKKEAEDYAKKHGYFDYHDPNFQRLNYVRYADDLLIGVISSKEKTIDIKNKIQDFLINNLKLEINDSKIKILHNSELTTFLGYNIAVIRSTNRPILNGTIALYLDYLVMKRFIIDNRFGKFVCDSKTGKPKLKGIHRPELINIDEIEILHQYNSRIKRLYNYYKLAVNISKLGNFIYVIQQSFLRTLAAKYKTTCAKLYKNKNYCRNKNPGVTFNNQFYELFKGPFIFVKYVTYENNIDEIVNLHKYFSKNSLIKRIEAKQCEFCGDENGPFEVHHVKKLKDLKGKASWEKLMISRKRKTMVLCKDCHHKLHAGKL